MSVERVTYVDSSAIVKLVLHEPESAALATALRSKRPLVSSALSRVEVERASLAFGDPVRERARQVLARFELLRISDRVLAAAGAMVQRELRSLDAIDLATASLFDGSLRALVTYDGRMRDAALALGWKVVAPA